MISNKLFTAQNVPNNRHLFGFESNSIDFVIYDLNYGVESRFKPSKINKKTENFCGMAKEHTNFEFCVDVLSENTLLILYQWFVDASKLKMAAFLKYDWDQKTYHLLDTKFYLLFCTKTCSSQNLFGNWLVCSSSRFVKSSIQVHKFNRQKLKFSHKKTIFCDYLSTLYWHVHNGELYAFKLDKDGTPSSIAIISLGKPRTTKILPTAGLQSENNKLKFKSQCVGAWHHNKFYFVKLMRHWIFDLDSFHWITLEKPSMFANIYYKEYASGQLLLTSSSSFVKHPMGSSADKLGLERRVQRLRFGQPDSLLHLTFTNLTTRPIIRKIVEQEPKVYQQQDFVNNDLLILLANECMNAQQTENVENGKRRLMNDDSNWNYKKGKTLCF